MTCFQARNYNEIYVSRNFGSCG